VGNASALIDYTDRNGSATVVLKQPHRRYLDEMFRLKCAPDLLVAGLFPNAKEWTESVGAYRAAGLKLRCVAELSDGAVTAFVVGDGSTPRTGAMLACRTAWTVHSIDPRAREKAWPIQRLTVHRCRVEDFRLEEPAGRSVVIAVHSHADLGRAVASVERCATVVGVVAIPCCEPQRLATEPDDDYHDWGIHSPERRVLVWRRA